MATLPQGTARLPKTMGLRDVVLFFVTSGTNLQWVASAAVAGPSAVTVWLIGIVVMFLPLALCVIELSSRYPEEGGMYVWSKHAFGDFAGFMTGWTYWTSNLPYFPALLYFAAANALFLFGEDRRRALADNGGYFIVVALAGLALGTVVNIAGLGVGKWLTNAGAVARWGATAILIGIGIVAYARFGSASEWSLATLRPGFGLRDMIFWSSIAFAFTGPEAASFMGDEIRDSRRTIPRGLFLAAPIIALIYIVGTVSVLVAAPRADLTGLQGIMQAVARGSERIGAPGLAPLTAALIAITALGSVGAWLGAVARIPFVAGIDRFLPASFGDLHPKWGSPWVALLTQSAVTVVFVVLGQAGTSVKGAYEVLVSMTFIVTFLPFLFVFSALIRVQGQPAGPNVIRIPGGRPVAVLMGMVGLATTVASIVLAVFPAADEPNKYIAVAKVVGLTLVLLATGMAVYFSGRRRAAREGHGA
jgi:amino acid transporter